MDISSSQGCDAPVGSFDLVLLSWMIDDFGQRFSLSEINITLFFCSTNEIKIV